VLPADGRDVRRAAGSKKKVPPGDGWIAAVAGWAARECGWSWNEILWEVPCSAIALLRRQDGLAAGKIFPLAEIEKIDDSLESNP
jgi:hypothetical protein